MPQAAKKTEAGVHVEFDKEEDGCIVADVRGLGFKGALAYGKTRNEAEQKALPVARAAVLRQAEANGDALTPEEFEAIAKRVAERNRALLERLADR